MRRVLFTSNSEAFRMRTDAPQRAANQNESDDSIRSEFTVGQAIIMLQTRDTWLARDVAKKLEQGTGIATPHDRQDLMAMHMLVIDRRGRYSLTPRGIWKANVLARDWARELGFDLLKYASHPRTYGGFRPGLFSQRGNS